MATNFVLMATSGAILLASALDFNWLAPGPVASSLAWMLVSVGVLVAAIVNSRTLSGLRQLDSTSPELRRLARQAAATIHARQCGYPQTPYWEACERPVCVLNQGTLG